MGFARAIPQHEGRVVRVRGLVQGVGFRPRVWHLARDCGLVGEVKNDGDGVLIRAWGEAFALDHFVWRLRADAPPLSRIDTIECSALDDEHVADEFRIVASGMGEPRTSVAADAATCRTCMEETLDPANRRYRYAFTNCTDCGPRLSIVSAIPYDRANTSMVDFALCTECCAEYENPDDRRFHAEPNACPVCGPKCWLERTDAAVSSVRPNGIDAVDTASALLQQGEIVAIKGIGGFHLACDATNADAVQRLRGRKRRYDKAFALMARDNEVIARYCSVGADEQRLLASPAAPIVLLQADGGERLPTTIAPGLNTLGFMLPYTPLHHLLLRDMDRPIVLTSGNLSDEPQCCGNSEARKRLASIADYLLLHDRDIINRLDDSVVRVMDGKPRVLRRSRGYAPGTLRLPPGFEKAPPVLALGGELKNTFCLTQHGQAIVSQHQGDLEDAATYADYRRNLSLYQRLFEHRPQLLAVDMHPEYLSSKLGSEWSERDGLPVEAIQHHHAHIASCLAENGVPLGTDPVLGVALDGQGYGVVDEMRGELWGGEFLLADYRSFTRVARFKSVALIGGAKAMREPWRNTYAHLCSAFGWSDYQQKYGALELSQYLAAKPTATLNAMLEHDINCPTASSCGRLFDAVAAAIGVCREEASYEGQAAVALEALVDSATLAHEDDSRAYPFELSSNEHLLEIDPAPMWRALLDGLIENERPAVIAARFHKGLARAIVAMVMTLRRKHAMGAVVLSGGVFQNKVLLEQVASRLREEGVDPLTHHELPANDGGLSLGQAVIAAARSLARGGAPCA